MKFLLRFYIAFLIAFGWSCSEQLDAVLAPVKTKIAVDSTIAFDTQIDSIIAPYKQELDSSMNEAIGTAAHTLKNEVSRGETTLGNFVSDLILYQSRKKAKYEVHLALINTHGGLRAPINEGEITVRDIFELMPFDNEILLLRLSGKELLQVFNHNAKDCRNSISPATFEIEDKTAKNIKINGASIDTSAFYNLAISDYLANGGGGFDFLGDAPRKSLRIKLRDMIIQHIKELSKEGKPVEANIENRIVIHDAE